MRTHEQNLDCIRTNLDRAQGRAQSNPTKWNQNESAELQQAEADYLKFMAGQIERHQMNATAKDLTTEMPSWGTSGT